jgi:hypothetical protein
MVPVTTHRSIRVSAEVEPEPVSLLRDFGLQILKSVSWNYRKGKVILKLTPYVHFKAPRGQTVKPPPPSRLCET